MVHELVPKHHLRMFWTKSWSYKNGVQDWFDCAQEHWFVNYTDADNPLEVNPTKNLLRYAADKLYYEKQLNLEQLQRIKEMIYSPDPDDLYMAISTMAELKPKKFRKRWTT